MKKQEGWKFSWKLINGEAQITAGRMENFLKINKRVYPSIWDLRVDLVKKLPLLRQRLENYNVSFSTVYLCFKVSSTYGKVASSRPLYY